MKAYLYLFSLTAFGIFTPTDTMAAEKLCGKTASLVIKADSQMHFTIPDKFKIESDYCDVPQGEKHANYIFKLLDATNRVIYQKKFILEEFSHFEEVSNKDEGKISKNKIALKGAQRILKIPLNITTEKATKFSITKIKNEELSSGGEFKW